MLAFLGAAKRPGEQRNDQGLEPDERLDVKAGREIAPHADQFHDAGRKHGQDEKAGDQEGGLLESKFLFHQLPEEAGLARRR